MITFVCQPGELEMKSALLAASLRSFHPADLSLRACVPALPGAALQGTTIALLQELQVEILSVPSPFGDAYPTGNKLACLASVPDGRPAIFLDSDLLCVGPLVQERFLRGQVSVKPADKNTFGGTAEDWRRICELAGVPHAGARVFSTVEREYMPCYYNSGALGTRHAASLGRKWIEVATRLDADARVPNKRPWLDQLSLPVAITALGLSVTHLSERENYPLNNRPLPGRSSPRFPLLVHYHSPRLLLSEPELLDEVRRLAERYPVLRVLADGDDWRALFERRFPKRRRESCAPPRNLLLTGPPRSGTSLLTHYLHEQEKVVAVNEPADLDEPLLARRPVLALQLYYRELRRRLLCDEPVDNKLDDEGRVAQDTFGPHQVRAMSPKIRQRDFLLCVKNPLAFMARLPHLMEEESNLAVLACIRHPMDTIGSWVASFEHLQRADLDGFPLGGLCDPHLSPWQRAQLERITGETDPQVRRCLLWRYLAELLWKYRTGLHLIPYEDLCRKPNTLLAGIIAPEKVARELPEETPRQSRERLSSREQRLVINLCGDLAEEFGYRL